MTSSSSECEYDDCPCGSAMYGNYTNPFHPTMGQPLIYYSQMPQPSDRRQRIRDIRKDNQNCFVKAFKWYTQEHVPTNDSPKSDVNAFAVWLDSKYEQFLRDSQLDKSIYHLKVKHTSVVEAARIPTPWRRKRKEAGDVMKPNKSFSYILQPKDLTRPASECCQQSDATIISTEMPMKASIRSKSYTCLSRNKWKDESVNMKREDTNLQKLDSTQKSDGNNRDFKSEKNLCEISCNAYKSQNKVTTSQATSCQCSVSKVVKMNAQTQCDSEINTTKSICQPCESKLSGHNVPGVPKQVQAKVSTPQNSIECQCSEELISKSDAQNHREPPGRELASSYANLQRTAKTCPCETSMDEFKVENLIRSPSPITFTSDATQSSDHSINFEKDAAYGHPLLLKIVCADKLLQ